MNITNEMLMAYADGELDTATRDLIATEIARNPTLASQVAQHEAMRKQLRGAFDSILSEPIPAELQSLLNAPRDSASLTNIDVARAKKSQQQVRSSTSFRWMSIAASLVIGVLIGVFALNNRDSAMLAASSAGIIAKGTLARSLSEQLASQPNNSASVKIGLSYLAKSGEFCRTFTMNDVQNLTGLACRSNNTWNVRMLMQTEASPESAYRTAASALPPAILEEVTRQMQGTPLDSDAELKAREQSWRATK